MISFGTTLYNIISGVFEQFFFKNSINNYSKGYTVVRMKKKKKPPSYDYVQYFGSA